MRSRLTIAETFGLQWGLVIRFEPAQPPDPKFPWDNLGSPAYFSVTLSLVFVMVRWQLKGREPKATAE